MDNSAVDQNLSEGAAGAVCLEDLFHRNADGLWRFFLLRCGDEAQAEDMMQELCLQLVRSKNKIAGLESSDGWIFGVARNVLRNHIRTQLRRRKNLPSVSAESIGELVGQVDSGKLPELALEDGETRDVLMLAITSLEGVDQEIIKLHYFDGLSFRDIAERMNMTPRSVEGRLYRARKALRGRLANMEI